MEGIKEVTDADKNLILPFIVQRKEEAQWIGWFEELAKKKKQSRLCAVGNNRIFFFQIGKKGVKPLKDAHLLEIKEIKSKDPKSVELVFKTFNVEMTQCAADELITNIRQNFENNFFSMPKAVRFRLAVEPESRLREVEGPNQAALAKSCGGFSGTYLSLCDFYGTPVRSDICWDMDNLLPANHVREFNMKEFEQPLSFADFKTLVDTLHFNTHFTAFTAREYKLDREAMKVLCDMLATNTKIEELNLVKVDAPSSSFEELGQAISKNRSSALTAIDWSGNALKDGGVVALGNAIGASSRGFTLLNIEGGDATKKATSLFCNSLKKNVEMARTLTVLNLAFNRLDNDGSNALGAFLSSTNALHTLNLASTTANLEVIFPAAMRGCSELTVLNISGNKITPKSGPELKKFLQAASKLRELHLADTAIPVNILRDVLKAIIGNKYLNEFHLDLADNKLGVLGANMVSGLAVEILTIETLDLTNNDFGDEGLSILAEGLCHNTSIKELRLGDNFKNKTKARGATMDNLIELACSECPLQKLDISASRSEHALQHDLLPFIYALATNDSIKELDISGHAVGDKCGIALGKALQTNRTLKSLQWDRNGTRLPGFVGFKVGLERNNVLTSMPLPILDISDTLKSHPANEVQQTINQISAAISRNESPKSKFLSSAGFSEHISMLGAGEREELQKLRQRIKAAGLDTNDQQARVLKDAEENDTYIASLQRIQEDLQQAMSDEVASRLGQLSGQLLPFLANTHDQLIDNLVDSIKKSYKSFDAEAVEKLRSDLHQNAANTLPKDAVTKVLAKVAAKEIASEVTSGLVSSLGLAVDFVFDNLLNNLEAMYSASKGAEHSAEPDTSKSQLSGSSGPSTSGSSGGVPTDVKRAVPMPPSKDTKPRAQPGPAVGPGPKPKPAPAVPKKPSGGLKTSETSLETAPVVESTITSHLTKDRPMGQQGRRKPQRRPQRRPMMSNAEA